MGFWMHLTYRIVYSMLVVQFFAPPNPDPTLIGYINHSRLLLHQLRRRLDKPLSWWWQSPPCPSCCPCLDPLTRHPLLHRSTVSPLPLHLTCIATARHPTLILKPPPFTCKTHTLEHQTTNQLVGESIWSWERWGSTIPSP